MAYDWSSIRWARLQPLDVNKVELGLFELKIESIIEIWMLVFKFRFGLLKDREEIYEFCIRNLID